MASITDFVHTLLEEYKELRGHRKNSGKWPFWDVVVITTADAAQQTAFELQIEDKRARSELPVDLPIFVISDPPGVRVGNGGSTLAVLESLHATYGRELFTLKIFLIHAGGWSQRMPSSSALGKVFSIIPHGSPPLQMLDLKLALYWPFVAKVQPGFFVVCADDFSVHNLGFDHSWTVLGTGFTALAHPSPMSLGRGHGVYVLANPESMDTRKHVVPMDCLEVLQKPDDQRMVDRGALLHGKSHCFADGIRLEGDVCYTDSCFYFGVDVMKKLLDFKKETGDLQCEIDAYGDFLQSLGKNADADYIHNTSNVSQVTPNLLSTRRKVFDLLNGSNINVLVLNASAYIHIGTAKELLFYMCRNEDFQRKLCLDKDVFNAWLHDRHSNGNGCVASNGASGARGPDKMSPFSCVIHSALPSDCVIGDDTYVEFCDFQIPVHISSQCIVSNCQVLLSQAQEASLTVPPSTFLHTVPISTDDLGETHYVTVVFSTDDNIKKCISSNKVSSLPFMGADVGTYLTSCGLVETDVLPKEALLLRKRANADIRENSVSNGADVNANEEKKEIPLSLWNLKLYPARASMTSSFTEAVKSRLGTAHWKKDGAPLKLFSLADLITFKDVKSMLEFRKKLNQKIRNA